MEGKRAATIVALCMLMLLLGQQQVAAMSFCTCYKICYDDYRRISPRWVCLPQCVITCKAFGERVAAPMSAADCSKICLLFNICGSAVTDTSGVAACVDDCTKNQSQYAKLL